MLLGTGLAGQLPWMDFVDASDASEATSFFVALKM
jgi:hypothetical protein